MAEAAARGPSAGRPRVGVSSCLVGQRVRYDGGHRRDAVVAGLLPRLVELCPVCPEMAIGLGAPRPPIRLEGDPAAPRALGGEHHGRDVTAALCAYGRRMADELGELSGYVFKSRSPSCGLRSAPVLADEERVVEGAGLYARELLAAHPLLPAIEEGALAEASRRAAFLDQVFALHRWRRLVAAGLTPERLLEFHAAHKLLLLAHAPARVAGLGRLAAEAGGGRPPGEVARRYIEACLMALGRAPTRAGHAAVLERVAGYLKRRLPAAERRALLGQVGAYRRGRISRAAALRAIRRTLGSHPDPYLAGQIYLQADPETVRRVEEEAPARDPR